MKDIKLIAMPLYGIGDVLMTTPAVRNISERTGAKITYLHMFKSTWEILQNNPHIGENMLFSFLERGKLAGLRFLYGLRRKYDVSINFYPSNRRDYNLAAFAVGCSERIGHRYVMRDIKELNFLKNRTLMENDSLHNVEENLRILEFLGVREPTSYPLEIYFETQEKTLATKWLEERGLGGAPLVGFHPGTSTFKGHVRKRWPEEKYSSLIREISTAYPEARFLIFGGSEEDPSKERIREGSGVKEKVFSISTSSIRETAALIGKCGVFVSNDSGLMHIAAACQVPTVAIFGPTNPVWVRPWMCRHRVIRCGPPCSPCFRYSPIPIKCETDNFCLMDVTVAEVLEAAVSMLREADETGARGSG